MSDQDIEDLFQKLREGNIVALSKAITIIESKLLKHQLLTEKLIKKSLPYIGNSIRIGISGIPGAGKSTFIESFGNILLEDNHKIAILAIDPSSSKTKGSILGDKTRMETLVQNPNVFIRPTATGEHLGGIAGKTREAIFLCEAAGFDVIIIETVGVGQSETLVHSMVDFFLFIQIAGAGDELQGIKKGIIEMSDAIIINKADGANAEKSILTKQILENTLHITTNRNDNWDTKVMTCSALEKINIDNIWKMIQDFILIKKNNGTFENNRNLQQNAWLYDILNQNIKMHFFENPKIKEALSIQMKKYKTKKTTPYEVASYLWNLFVSEIK